MALHVKRTGSTAMSVEVDPGKSWAVHEVRLHLSAAGGAGTYTVAIKSAVGDAYNVVLHSQDMTSATDTVFRPVQPLRLADTDTLVMVYANASSRVWGLEVVFE